jgi:hypothetical protein
LDPELPATTPLPVDKRFFLGYTAMGEDVYFEGENLPASKEDYDFVVGLSSLIRKLLEQRALKNHPVVVNAQGTDLEGVIEGLKLLKDGKISGKKLVYTIQ